MKTAIIDLGTNTFNLLITKATENGAEVLYKTKIPVQLGKGGITKRHIEPDAFKRGTDALREFSRVAEEHKCDRIRAFATAAIREADNGHDFVDASRRKTGINIDVIDGQREAELIYRGVAAALPLEGNVLIMDIGGGSTEFIIADQNEIKWKQSFELGVTRLFEMFAPEDPMSAEDHAAITNYLVQELKPLQSALKQNACSTLVGASGSFTTFTTLEENRFPGGNAKVDQTWCALDINSFHEIAQQLVDSTYEERLADQSIPEFRAVSIHLSSMLVSTVLEMDSFNRLLRSSWSLKEGAMAEMSA